MVQNYTPLNLEKFQQQTVLKPSDGNKINTILIVIATITTAILAALLFILIQKKLQQQSITPEAVPSNATNSAQPTSASASNQAATSSASQIEKLLEATPEAIQATIIASQPAEIDKR